jgi:hypothetical protein
MIFVDKPARWSDELAATATARLAASSSRRICRRLSVISTHQLLGGLYELSVRKVLDQGHQSIHVRTPIRKTMDGVCCFGGGGGLELLGDEGGPGLGEGGWI